VDAGGYGRVKIIIRRFDKKEPAIHTETIDDSLVMDVVFEVNGKQLAVSVLNGWLDVSTAHQLIIEPKGANVVNIRGIT
jgi:hypothetical protein